MKELDNSIKSLEKRIGIYHVQANKLENEGRKDDQIFNEGIAEGIRIALEEIQKANTKINTQIQNLL